MGRRRMAYGLIALAAAALPAAVAARPEDAARERLVRVVALVRDSYAGRVDIAALEGIGAEALRQKAGVAEDAWRRCIAAGGAVPPESGRANDGGLAAALGCARAPGLIPADALVDAALDAMLATLEGKNGWLTPSDSTRSRRGPPHRSG